MADATKSSPEPAGTPGTGLTKKQRQRQRKKQQQKQKQQQNGNNKVPAVSGEQAHAQTEAGAENEALSNDSANDAHASPEGTPESGDDAGLGKGKEKMEDSGTRDSQPEWKTSMRELVDESKSRNEGVVVVDDKAEDAGAGADKGGNENENDNSPALKEEGFEKGQEREQLANETRGQEDKKLGEKKTDTGTDLEEDADAAAGARKKDEAVVEALAESLNRDRLVPVPASATTDGEAKAADAEKPAITGEREAQYTSTAFEQAQEQDEAARDASHQAKATSQDLPSHRQQKPSAPLPPHTTTGAAHAHTSPYAPPPHHPLESEKYHPRAYHTSVTASESYHPPIPSSVPPPPTDAQVQRMHEKQQASGQSQQQQQQPQGLLPQGPHQPPESIARPNLSHPPGYIQNTAALTSPIYPSPSVSPSSPAPVHSGQTGRWTWSPAPGDAGGRYVFHSHVPSSSLSPANRNRDTVAESERDREAEWVYIDANGNEYPGPAVQGSAYIGNTTTTGTEGSSGLGIGSGDVDDWAAWLGEVWYGAVGWVRGVGGVVAEWEEGVWRWVNERT